MVTTEPHYTKLGIRALYLRIREVEKVARWLTRVDPSSFQGTNRNYRTKQSVIDRYADVLADMWSRFEMLVLAVKV